MGIAREDQKLVKKKLGVHQVFLGNGETENRHDMEWRKKEAYEGRNTDKQFKKSKKGNACYNVVQSWPKRKKTFYIHTYVLIIVNSTQKQRQLRLLFGPIFCHQE